MSIATQIERLQGVRDQIRTKMVSLGLSENTDLLQNLADDLDGVNKVSPTNNGTTDPGSSYTNVDTLSRSTSTRYIKVPKGYNDADRKFTVSGVANGSYSASVASHTTSNATASSSVAGSVTNIATTTKPSGTDGTNYYTITPKLTTASGSSKATGKATIDTAGYLAAGNKSSSESSKTVGVTATQGDSYYLKAGAYSASVASHTTSNATASSSVSGTVTSVATTTAPSGTDGTDYYTITPKLTTAAGSSKATGKATIGTAGYLATGSATSSESSKTVGVTASQGANYYLKAGSYSASVASHTTSNASASSSVTGSVTGITTTTKPSGTDGTDYYTITPKLTTAAGSSKATGKATIGTAGYLAAGNKSSSESSKTVGVTATQGSDYYLKAGSYSASVSSHTVKTKPTASSSISGTITDIASTVKPTGNYYTITPSLSTTTGSVEAVGKATISTAGYIATGSKTEGNTIDVSVSATQGKDYYLRTGEYSISVPSHTTTNATASSSVSGTITGITTTTAPASGTDGTDYYTITPKLTTGAGKSKVRAKATVGTAGYLATGSKETSEASKDVSVSATQGSSYYLPASTFGSETTTNPTSSTNLKSVTAGTAVKYIPVNAGYRSAGKITVNPTLSETKEYIPTLSGKTIEPTPGSLLSSVTVKGVPTLRLKLSSGGWGNSDSNVTAGKYYYDIFAPSITASNNLYVMPDDASAAQSFGVYAYSQSRLSEADMGALQFRAMERPTSDLTYTVYYLN